MDPTRELIMATIRELIHQRKTSPSRTTRNPGCRECGADMQSVWRATQAHWVESGRAGRPLEGSSWEQDLQVIYCGWYCRQSLSEGFYSSVREKGRKEKGEWKFSPWETLNRENNAFTVLGLRVVVLGQYQKHLGSIRKYQRLVPALRQPDVRDFSATWTLWLKVPEWFGVQLKLALSWQEKFFADHNNVKME